MINRYINSEIDSIWNDQNKFNTWKLVQEKYLEKLFHNKWPRKY